MRLICPNCDAEYEVDASAIPEIGRAVQCSNCGHSWFQMPPDLGPTLIDAADETMFEVAGHAALTPAAPASGARSPAPTGRSADTARSEDLLEDDVEGASDLAVAARPRPLEGSLLSVLREEAERETAARRAEAPQPIETQTDLDLPEPVQVVVRHASSDADVGGVGAAVTSGSAAVESAVEGAVAGVRAGEDPQVRAHRRDMLPDVEEITSTLRPVDDGDVRSRRFSAGADAARPRGGFATGFFLMLLLACAVVALYVLAPRLAAELPAVAPVLERFVAAVDALRIWLDETVRTVIIAVGNAS